MVPLLTRSIANECVTNHVTCLKMSNCHNICLQMKSTEVDLGLFTDSYCKVCSAQLISESQRVAHYEVSNSRTHTRSHKGDVDKNKCCTLCNMSFTSAVVAQSHYQGKIHAKRLRLLLGEPPAITSKDSPGSPSIHDRLSHRYCQMCKAWFNNPGMARQHYDGKKHKKNAAQANLLAQLGKSLKRSHTCEVCSVTLNSVAQYHAHLQGSKHQNKDQNQSPSLNVTSSEVKSCMLIRNKSIKVLIIHIKPSLLAKI
uniref:Zinc finger matrin-type protein 4-like n=1 Tax=Sinocyclocheilus rhinocerous TaxID=307959 RepID=A0A673KWH7_9TELE